MNQNELKSTIFLIFLLAEISFVSFRNAFDSIILHTIFGHLRCKLKCVVRRLSRVLSHGSAEQNQYDFCSEHGCCAAIFMHNVRGEHKRIRHRLLFHALAFQSSFPFHFFGYCDPFWCPDYSVKTEEAESVELIFFLNRFNQNRTSRHE